VYGATKAAGEWLVLLANLDALIVRSSGLYGVAGASGKGGNFIQTVIRLARDKGEMRIVNDQFLSPTYTADLASAIAKLVQCNASGIFHITNGDSCSWYELACHVIAATGLRAAVHPISTAEFGAPVRRPAYSVLENARWRELGLESLRPWREAMKVYLEAKGLITGSVEGRA
jgi:dTDP-4-dehydrorhamnose reductase